jgi:hypothetical protein
MVGYNGRKQDTLRQGEKERMRWIFSRKKEMRRWQLLTKLSR